MTFSGTVLAKESSQSLWLLVQLLCLPSDLLWEASWGECGILAVTMLDLLKVQIALQKDKCGWLWAAPLTPVKV